MRGIFITSANGIGGRPALEGSLITKLALIAGLSGGRSTQGHKAHSQAACNGVPLVILASVGARDKRTELRVRGEFAQTG